MTTTATKTPTRVATDYEPIDRLEEKVKLLVAMIGRIKSEQARMAEENMRLTRELDGGRAELADARGPSAEAALLRQERDVIRTRVEEMLGQLEALHL